MVTLRYTNSNEPKYESNGHEYATHACDVQEDGKYPGVDSKSIVQVGLIVNFFSGISVVYARVTETESTTTLKFSCWIVLTDPLLLLFKNVRDIDRNVWPIGHGKGRRKHLNLF